MIDFFKQKALELIKTQNETARILLNRSLNDHLFTKRALLDLYFLEMNRMGKGSAKVLLDLAEYHGNAAKADEKILEGMG